MIFFLALLAAASADPFAGSWVGTSLCQVKPSACNDEHVVYRIAATGPGRYRADGYKIVGGKEQFMGSLDLSRDRNRLSGSNIDRAGAIHPWIFVLEGKHLSGRALTSPNGRIFRLIEVDKQ